MKYSIKAPAKWKNSIYVLTEICIQWSKRLGPKLKVHGLQGLRVADASIMPNLISGNTQVACYTIGEKASDLILEERFYSKYDKTQAWCNLQVSEFQIGKMIQRSNLVHFIYIHWL